MFTQFYGFDRRPFRLTPDPAFYFESKTHRKALSCLQYGLAEEEGVIVVTGEAGAGKSLLTQRLHQMLAASDATVVGIVSSALDDEELLAVVGRKLGLGKTRGKADALTAIERFLHQRAQDGGRLVLIVDEAQHLTPNALEELRMLANVQVGGRALVQSVLVGSPAFAETLAHSPQLNLLRERIIASHHLSPLNDDEIEPYIVSQLARAGWQGRPTFEPAIWPAIMMASGGIPRSVNRIMNRLLLLGAVDQADRLDGEMLENVLEELTDEGFESDQHANATTDAKDSPVQKAEPQDRPDPDEDARVSETAETWNDDTQEMPPPGYLLEEQLDVIERAFAERDEHIAALRDQVEEVIRRTDARSGTEGRGEKVAALDARLDEHERSLRHLLQMMIAYFETGIPPAAD